MSLDDMDIVHMYALQTSIGASKATPRLPTLLYLLWLDCND